MKHISKNFRDLLFDACNDVEIKMQRTEEYKEIMKQLELKENQLVNEADASVRRELLFDIDEINMDRYNLVVSAIVEMVATQGYMYDRENDL